MERLTESRENYLLALHGMDQEADGTRLTDLADAMGVTLSSAYAAVKELEAIGLVTRGGSRMIYLTVSGRREASRIRGRHRTVLRFLTEVLGIGVDQALDEASAVEHVLSEESYRALSGLLPGM